ncbi:hypothetical protein M4I21_05045 [Cellulophaga sp. 20_2_10]|uniref:hypothetical protein n=1 Tax=Cellulophaga sp. 20_2_10 TaxID=2942476 RepID=UPI00201AB911|nr:hypothetical protein [Cellulophaga sp. 20_2_10]MCL5245164.1 hypothetical protein [Cellulophaga sp. 20_2_10]
MKQKLLLVCLALFTSIGYAQISIDELNINSQLTDRIQFSKWEVHTKEMSKPGDTEKEYKKELKRVTLSKEDQELISAKLKDPESYTQERDLLYHYDLVFLFYKEDVVVTEVRLSTLTGNIDIDNKLTKSSIKSKCANTMKSVLLNLLRKHEFLSEE